MLIFLDCFFNEILNSCLSKFIFQPKAGQFKNAKSMFEIPIPAEMSDKKFGQPSFGDMGK